MTAGKPVYVIFDIEKDRQNSNHVAFTFNSTASMRCICHVTCDGPSASGIGNHASPPILTWLSSLLAIPHGTPFFLCITSSTCLSPFVHHMQARAHSSFTCTSHTHQLRSDKYTNSAMAVHFTALPAFRGGVRFPSKQAVTAFHFGFR